MNEPPPLPRPFAPVAPDWRHAWGGVWRLTYHRTFTPGRWMVTALLVALLAFLTYVNARLGSMRHFGMWTINFYLTVLIPFLAFLSGGGAIRDEMRPGTEDYVFTRPVRRTAFVGFKFLAHLACAQLFYLLALAAVVTVGFVRDVPGMAAALPVLVTAQILTVAVFMAFGFACGSFTGRFVVIGLLYAGIIEAGLGSANLSLNRLSLIHHVKRMVAGLWDTGSPEPESLLAGGALLLAVAAAWVLVAALFFSWRELAAQKPRAT